jgi:hypothetical protein
MVPVIGNVALLCATIALFVGTMRLDRSPRR